MTALPTPPNPPPLPSHPSPAHTHVLSFGLGLNIVILPTSLTRIDAELTYSPTQLPPPSALSTTSSPSSVEASPLSAAGGLPETPTVSTSTSSSSGENGATVDGIAEGTVSGGEGVGAGRLPSLDISAYMHLDGLYSKSAFDTARQQQQQPEQYPPSHYGD